MQEDRRDAAEADEDGGGGDEEYVSRMKENVRGVSKRVGHVSLWFK